MPRRERPLADGDSRVVKFASDLRRLRESAGRPTYRVLSMRAHCSAAALSDAASGRKLPSLQITLAYVLGCGGEAGEWERRWHELAAELAVPVVRNDVDPPYVGLATFRAEDADRFFGREHLVGEVEAKLREQRFLGVFGASGTGKSSILRAGLQPRLGRVVLFTPGNDPLEELAIQLAALLGGSPGALRDELVGDPRGLSRIVRRPQDDDPELVIVVDQFEEVFTHGATEADRDHFIDLLITAAHAQHSRCRVVIGVRADFYAHCAGHAGLVEALRDAQVTVGPMTAAELRSAIVQPAARGDLAVEGALLATLIKQASGDAGALPLLSHVLLETWYRRRGNTLTLAGYETAGGIAGALAQTADAVYETFDDEQGRTVRWLLLRLTTTGTGAGDVRRRVPVAELDLTPAGHAVVDRLTGIRLLTRDRDTLEITHEALLRGWPRLRDWLAEDLEGLRIHRRLTEAARIWESLDRDPGALYRGTSLEAAREWRGRADIAVNRVEREFLEASAAAAEAELATARRHAIRSRQLVAVLGVLLLFATMLIVVAVHAEQNATGQRNNALSEVAAGKAAGLRTSNPGLAAQLSLVAFRLSPTDEATKALLGSVPLPLGTRLTGHRDHVNAVAVAPDSRLAATASHDGTAILWDIAERRRPRASAVLSGHKANVNGVAFSPDQRRLATAGWDHTALLWDITDPSAVITVATLGAHHGDVNSVSFSPDNTLLITTSTDATAKLWSTGREPQELATLSAGHGGVVSGVISRDRRFAATANWDGTAALWPIADPRNPGLPVILRGHTAPVVSVAFSPHGRILATAAQDRTVRLWEVVDPSAPRELAVLAGHDGTVRSVEFSLDGGTIATASEDQTVRLWRLQPDGTAATFTVLRGHTAPAVTAAFGADGRILMTGGDDNAALLWHIPATPLDQLQPEEAARIVCSAIADPISEADWHRYLPDVDYRPPCPADGSLGG
ncbi:NACHT and WD repeat domain-containing protein [Amycolatopsis sp. cmx-4-54]|uniref:NACHT and WD repeat domain-containing protein n=1 Tax=Amycolatopsis sp. cmx-4-54 TaxID=2790936 RepID=UPI003978D106